MSSTNDGRKSMSLRRHGGTVHVYVAKVAVQFMQQRFSESSFYILVLPAQQVYRTACWLCVSPWPPSTAW